MKVYDSKKLNPMLAVSETGIIVPFTSNEESEKNKFSYFLESRFHSKKAGYVANYYTHEYMIHDKDSKITSIKINDIECITLFFTETQTENPGMNYGVDAKMLDKNYNIRTINFPMRVFTLVEVFAFMKRLSRFENWEAYDASIKKAS